MGTAYPGIGCVLHMIAAAASQTTPTGSFLSMSKFWFNKLPEAIARALSAVDPEGIAGYLLCALERRGRVTGLVFCDLSGRLRDGSPVQTGVIEDRAWVEGYELVIATDGVYVIAHRSHENGATDAVVCWH